MPDDAGSAPIRVALVGAGSASRAYLRTLDSMVAAGVAVPGAVFDRNPARLRDLVQRRPSSEVSEQLDGLLESDASLVVITTPPASHAELTRQALEAGKHVLVEKPLAPTLAEGRELVELAHSRGLLLVVAPFVQLSPAFAMLHRFCSEHVLGDIHSARAMYGNTGSSWASWYHTSGVGPLGDLAVYNIKSLAVLLGPVTQVQAWSSTSSMTRHLPDGAAATDPDTVNVRLQHRDGASSTILASHAVWAYRRPAIELYGTEGTANLLGDDWDPDGIEVYRGEWGHWRSYASPDRTWNWTDGLRTAVHALRTGDQRGLDNHVDLHVLEVVLAARDSASDGGAPAAVTTTFAPPSLPDVPEAAVHVHDHSRPASEQ